MSLYNTAPTMHRLHSIFYHFIEDDRFHQRLAYDKMTTLICKIAIYVKGQI